MKPRHPVPRSLRPNQRTSVLAHPVIRVIPVNHASHASRASREKAAVTAVNLVKAAHVEMAALPTTVGEPRPPVVQSQAVVILKPSAMAPKAVVTAKAEAAVRADRNAPRGRLVHLGKTARPAEAPIQTAVQRMPLRWIRCLTFKMELCRQSQRTLVYR
jgi:hypothetical protein